MHESFTSISAKSTMFETYQTSLYQCKEQVLNIGTYLLERENLQLTTTTLILKEQYFSRSKLLIKAH